MLVLQSKGIYSLPQARDEAENTQSFVIVVKIIVLTINNGVLFTVWSSSWVALKRIGARSSWAAILLSQWIPRDVTAAVTTFNAGAPRSVTGIGATRYHQRWRSRLNLALAQQKVGCLIKDSLAWVFIMMRLKRIAQKNWQHMSLKFGT